MAPHLGHVELMVIVAVTCGVSMFALVKETKKYNTITVIEDQHMPYVLDLRLQASAPSDQL